jgi:hypothetical protein
MLPQERRKQRLADYYKRNYRYAMQLDTVMTLYQRHAPLEPG